MTSTSITTACNTGETAPPEPTRAEQVEQDIETAQGQQFQEEAARNLAQLQDELAQLEVEAQLLDEEARVEFDKQLTVLEQQAAEAERQLEALQRAGANAWEEMEPEVKTALDELGNAIVETATVFGLLGKELGQEIEQELLKSPAEVEETAVRLETYTFNQRDAFQQDASQVTAWINQQLAELETQVAQADEQTQQEVNDTMVALRRQANELEQQLNVLNEATLEEEWEELSSEVINSLRKWYADLQTVRLELDPN